MIDSTSAAGHAKGAPKSTAPRKPERKARGQKLSWHDRVHSWVFSGLLALMVLQLVYFLDHLP